MPKAEKNKINVKERIDDVSMDLSLSDISEIPTKDIALYKRVTQLDLSNNQILTLGKDFGSLLSHLTKLDLSKNQISFLPEDFGKLTNLKHLDLYNNKLVHLPLGFGHLKNLRYLDLKSNPITPALLQIIGPCLTTKECQTAARKTVGFLAEMRVQINEERLNLQREKEIALQLEKQQQQEQEKIAQREKMKLKKAKKKEINQEKLPSENDQPNLSEQNGTSQQTTFTSSAASSSNNRSLCGSTFKFLFFSLFCWFLFACTFLYLITKNPTYTSTIIEYIPKSYQPVFAFHLEQIRTTLQKYFRN